MTVTRDMLERCRIDYLQVGQDTVYSSLSGSIEIKVVKVQEQMNHRRPAIRTTNTVVTIPSRIRAIPPIISRETGNFPLVRAIWTVKYRMSPKWRYIMRCLDLRELVRPDTNQWEALLYRGRRLYFPKAAHMTGYCLWNLKKQWKVERELLFRWSTRFVVTEKKTYQHPLMLWLSLSSRMPEMFSLKLDDLSQRSRYFPELISVWKLTCSSNVNLIWLRYSAVKYYYRLFPHFLRLYPLQPTCLRLQRLKPVMQDAVDSPVTLISVFRLQKA